MPLGIARSLPPGICHVLECALRPEGCLPTPQMQMQRLHEISMAMQMLVGGVSGAVPLLSLQALPAALASTPSAVWEPMIAKVRRCSRVPDVQPL